MKSINQTYAGPLPDGLRLPPAAAMLFGYVDATESGYRELELGATTYTLGPAIYRGDELAAALTAAGASTSHTAGLFTVFPEDTTTLTATDRLAVLLGLLERAGMTTGSGDSFASGRISPVAIPLAGYSVTQQRIDADDERIGDRLERDMGYIWGGARVVTVRATLHKWALDAYLFGWVQRGLVTVVGSQAAELSGAVPGGSVTGRVLSAGQPSYLGDARFWAEVELVLAVEES